MREALLYLMLLELFIPQSQLARAQAAPAKPHFTMGPSAVLLPEGFFVLVRKGSQIGAIKLIQIKQNAKFIGTSTYESYYQGNGSHSFVTPSVVKRTGLIDIKPIRGTHEFAWQPGKDKLFVGPWWFGCITPSLVNMSSHFDEEDDGFEFAATSARSVAEINALDSRLRWFRYEENTSTVLDLSDLPR